MAQTAVDTEFLREQIDRRYATHAAFAKECGVSRQFMHAVLNGKREPSLSLLIVMADKLKVRVDKLLRGVEVIQEVEEGRAPGSRSRAPKELPVPA